MVYDNRNSRRSNNPMGHMRTELVRCTKDDELVLSGSPVEYFIHSGYQTGDWRTAQTTKWGVHAVYNHTDAAWVNPNTKLTGISEDGFTLTFDSTANIDEDDLCEIYYYASHRGNADYQEGCQCGDVVSTETVSALLKKVNNCPPLNFVNAGMVFDSELGLRSVTTPGTGTTLYLDYNGALGTWQTTDLPFYVTGAYIAWNGDTCDADRTNGLTAAFWVRFKFDSGSTLEYNIPKMQRVMVTYDASPAYDQASFCNLGLLEIESDIEVSVNIPSSGFLPTGVTVALSGWHI